MGLYWCSQLTKELKEKCRIGQIELEDAELRREEDIKTNQRARRRVLQKEATEKEETLTKDKLEQAEKEERDALTQDCHKAIKASREKYDKMQLDGLQGKLLHKIVDFSAL